MNALSSIKNSILELLFPFLCAACGKEGRSLLCSNCRGNMRLIPPSCFVCRKLVPTRGRIPAGRTCHSCRRKSDIYAFLSPFSYSDPVIRDLIHGLKYNRIYSVAPILGDLLAKYCEKFGIVFPRGVLMLPVPLYKSRERTRGFNQSLLIAGELGKKKNIPVAGALLIKMKKTRPQIELPAEERRQNVVGSFVVPDSSAAQGRTIVLLDDVKTTGATLEEAAKILKIAGAKRVWAITIAH